MEKQLICRDCALFDKTESVCRVTILRDGEYYEITTRSEDRCHWEEAGIPIQEVKVWSDGENGYVQMPENESFLS